MAPKKAVLKSQETHDERIAKTYVKVDQVTHVLLRPGMYIGSIEPDTVDLWVLNEAGSKMEKQKVQIVPGLYKIFDEILTNATDHRVRLLTKKKEEVGHHVKNIMVTIDKETGVIEISNDGDGIEVVKHPEQNIYIPELLFANMLSSTNFNDQEEKVIGGQNGIGAKACNIFSEFLEIETVDATRKLLYRQRFEKNMSIIHEPTIEKCAKKPYTTFRFKPDFKLFKMEGLTDDMYKVMRKRVYDACAVTDKEVTIHFNGEKLDIKTFEKYADLYIGTKSEQTRVYEEINDRWEVIASYNESNGFEQISFANGIWTIRGGKHVDYIANQIAKKLVDLISKKKKDLTIKPQTVKDNLILFVKCKIVNPTFDSQSKETLTTPVAQFGSKAEVSDKFIEKLYKSGIVERIIEISQLHANQSLKKTDGKKRNVIRGIHKLDDANWAGTDKSKECTLILTEGDSAKTMAIAGISKVGRDRYGVFPLRGKLMNVKDVENEKIGKNEEISNLKKILGLESNKTYKDLNDLRYGKIMIMTDQDVDGSHIKGLLFNMFHALWPSLMQCNEFISSMMTPIVKVTKGKDQVAFYNLSDFETWKQETGDMLKGWTVKYYKGLGTSTEEEAIQYFKELKTVDYKYTGETSDQSMELAFNKKKSDDRKEWLGTYDSQDVLDIKDKEVSYEDFVHKELKHFSKYDLERSIPNINDGLKTSQRKIMYGCFKKNISHKEIKVAQLAGYVSENAAYHHGEASLQQTIVGLAQDFVGSNNINLLLPNGQFGSRMQGGKDASQPRYIFTMLNSVTEHIFNKHDLPLLTYKNDDGDPVEPEFYPTVIPMVLVNGASGIGTGFSTNIPCYNPKDIIHVLKELLNGRDYDGDLVPWYCGFTGTIEKHKNKYISRGRFRKVSATKVEVTELPVGYWTDKFKEDLEMMLDEKDSMIKHYESNSSHLNVHFTIHFSSSDRLDELMVVDEDGFTKFETKFNLISSKPLCTTNMYLFNSKLQIQKYTTPIDIIREYYVTRLEFYQKRKDYLLAQLMKDIRIKENKIRFIKETISQEILVSELTKKQLEDTLESREYMQHNDSYNYLIEIPIYKQTKDEVTKLEGEIQSCRDEYDVIDKKTIENMWLDDLEKLEKMYEKYVHVREDKYPTHPLVKSVKKAPVKEGVKRAIKKKDT